MIVRHKRAEKDAGTRTSFTDPLIIDALEIPGCSGVIGMTFCPGKKGMGIFSGEWDRDLGTDLAAIREWGAGTLVSLIEEHEFRLLGVGDLGSQALEADLVWYHLPIRDVSVPGQMFPSQWVSVGTKLCQELRAGGRVVLHCRGGLGRTGLVAALLLIELGVMPQEAVALVRKARRGTIETAGQEKYVNEWQPLCSV